MAAVYASTSRAWFDVLHGLEPKPPEVAFWRPSDVQARRIDFGEPWFFKEWGAPQLLGFGRFVEYETTTPHALWERFGRASGANTLSELLSDISAARRAPTFSAITIGNVVLSDFAAFNPPILLADAGLQNLPVPFRYVPDGNKIISLVPPRPFDLPPPITARRKELVTEIFARNIGHVARIRNLYGGVCQVTGKPVLGAVGGDLTQIHHIDFLYQGGADDPSNMMSLSPNWHALVHTPGTTFDWATLEFVVGRRRRGLAMNKHLMPK